VVNICICEEDLKLESSALGSVVTVGLCANHSSFLFQFIVCEVLEACLTKLIVRTNLIMNIKY